MILNSYLLTSQNLPLVQAQFERNSFNVDLDSSATIGILITLQKDWHIYWKNPGDSGIPTTIELDLPAGFTNTEIKFPVPKIFSSSEIVNYGYDNKILFMTDIIIPKENKQKIINVSANVSSLICKELCVAFDTTVITTIDLSKNFYADNKIVDLFNQIIKSLPIVIQSFKFDEKLKTESLLLTIFNEGNQLKNVMDVYFYSYQTGLYANEQKQNFEIKNKNIYLTLKLDPFRANNPTEIFGLLYFKFLIDDVESEKYFEVQIPVIN